MGIFGKKMIDIVEWKQEDPGIIAYHSRGEYLTAYTQLIVYESQEAVFFRDGEMIGKFGAGRHTLNSKNLPLLNELYGIPFGDKKPFPAEVWFINLLDMKSVLYATDMFRYHDPDYCIMLPLICRGRYGVRVSNSTKFIKKVLGTRNVFTVKDLTTYMQSELSTYISSLVSSYMQANTIGLKAISSYLSRMSTALLKEMRVNFDEYGLELIAFHLNSIDVDDSREEGKQIIRAMAEKSAQELAGYSWQQKQAFDLAERQVNVAGEAMKGASKGGMGILGAMLLINGGGRFGEGIPRTVSEAMSHMPGKSPMERKSMGQMAKNDEMVFCSKCSKKYPKTSKYCPYCGDVYNACPNCGWDNDITATTCVNCNKALTAKELAICPKCGASVLANASFCQNCGSAQERICSKCHTKLKSGVEFCPNCGRRY